VTPLPQSEKIVITKEDLQDPKIDERLAQQRYTGPAALQPVEEKGGLRFIYATWFYLMIAGIAGALIAWAIIEPYFADGIMFTGRVEQVEPEDIQPGIRKVVISHVKVAVVAKGTTIRGGAGAQGAYSVDTLRPGMIVKLRGELLPTTASLERMLVAEAIRIEPPGTAAPPDVDVVSLGSLQETVGFLLFPTVAGFIGLLVGAVEGIICRTLGRALRCGLLGFAAGFVGGCVSIMVGGLIYRLLGQISDNPTANAGAFVLQIFRRGLAWLIAGTAMGLGQGLALRSKRLVLNGLIGGIVGGLAGGLLFDPISLVFSDQAAMRGAGLSRAIGFLVIGGSVGLMIGITDLLTRSAWLRVTAGPLRGKEFNFYQTPIRLGSSPKNEIYLFKDPKIDPVHANINKLRDTYELADNNSHTGTVVNGQRITRKRLLDGDRIQIGDSEFVYTTRDKTKAA
jgi:hypothetical protein